MSFEEEPSTAEPRLGEERLGSWRLLAANKVTVVAFVVLVIVVLVAVLAPWIAPYGVNEVNVSGALQGPSWAHPFVTDDLCRNILSRVMIRSAHGRSPGSW